MEGYCIYLGLKVVPMSLLWGIYMYYSGTWTLWGRAPPPTGDPPRSALALRAAAEMAAVAEAAEEIAGLTLIS